MTDFLEKTLVREKTISDQDLSIVRVTDSPEEAVRWIAEVGMARFDLTHGPRLAIRRRRRA